MRPGSFCAPKVTERHKVHKQIHFQRRKQNDKETDLVVSLAIEAREKDISRKNLLVLKYLCPAEALNDENYHLN